MEVGDGEFRGAVEVGDGEELVRSRFGVRASTATMALVGVVGAVAAEEGKVADMGGKGMGKGASTGGSTGGEGAGLGTGLGAGLWAGDTEGLKGGGGCEMGREGG